jgi:hypothetical protein
MRNDSSQNYKTKYSNVANFKQFMDNIHKEKDKLQTVDRQLKKGDREISNPKQDGMNFNSITNKMDKNLTKKDLEDRIKALEDGGVEETDHKYGIVDLVPDKTMENFDTEFHQGGMHDDMNDSSETTSYMFFKNIQTVHRLVEEMLQYDHQKVNELLNDGHNWAEDHLSVAKENVSHVYNFVANKLVKENHEGYNYMFFENLESIHKMCQKLTQMDESQIDEVLQDGHDWAEDHISAAKENIEQVHDFLENEMM